MIKNKYNIPLNISDTTYINNSIDHYHKPSITIYQRILLILTIHSPDIRTGIRLDKKYKNIKTK